jgi:DNA-binding beta-propeller fold protein YncE
MAVGTASPLAQLAFDAPPDVRAALETLGRTEDVRFTPSGRRLAIASFHNERIAVADVEVTASASEPEVAVTRLEQLASPSLSKPHGLDFLDEETLVVGNRTGGVAVLRLPALGSADGVARMEQLGPDAQGSDGPGSVLVDSHDPERRWVLVCNNWTSVVTRHAVGPGGTLGPPEIVARKGLDLPDGLALSRDGRWLVTSNHTPHSVLVHPYPTAGDDSDPVAVLRGVIYPHGMRFSADDRYLLVADAGRPYVHVFSSPSDGWRGAGYSQATIRVMDDETFSRGHHNSAEGGPKGIDIHPQANVLAVTAECLPLAFFDLETALAHAAPTESGEVLLQYELDLLAEKDALKASAERQVVLLRDHLDRVLIENTKLRDARERSRSRNFTRPLRAVAARLRLPR